jgi:serine/threonine-protein kinase HipA
MSDAKINLWGSQIGAVTWVEDRQVGVFQYDPDFLRSGIQLAPLKMPLTDTPYSFPGLARQFQPCGAAMLHRQAGDGRAGV